MKDNTCPNHMEDNTYPYHMEGNTYPNHMEDNTYPHHMEKILKFCSFPICITTNSTYVNRIKVDEVAERIKAANNNKSESVVIRRKLNLCLLDQRHFPR